MLQEVLEWGWRNTWHWYLRLHGFYCYIHIHGQMTPPLHTVDAAADRCCIKARSEGELEVAARDPFPSENSGPVQADRGPGPGPRPAATGSRKLEEPCTCRGTVTLADLHFSTLTTSTAPGSLLRDHCVRQQATKSSLSSSPPNPNYCPDEPQVEYDHNQSKSGSWSSCLRKRSAWRRRR